MEGGPACTPRQGRGRQKGSAASLPGYSKSICRQREGIWGFTRLGPPSPLLVVTGEVTLAG